MDLSIVILCYRAEEAIIPFAQETLALAEKLNADFEIILVSNFVEGSGDKTPAITKSIAENDSRFSVVAKPKKGMMGWDMRAGLAAAKGDYICVTDGDGQFPIASIEQCYKEIKTGSYDLVKTYRSERHDGFYRKLISKVYNFVFKILFPRINSKDANSKPKIMTRSAYEKMNLESKDWFIDAEIMLAVRRYKMKYLEFPIVFLEIEGRKSFVNFSAIFEFIKNMFQYWIRENFGRKKK